MRRYQPRCKRNKKIHANEPGQCNQCCMDKKIHSNEEILRKIWGLARILPVGEWWSGEWLVGGKANGHQLLSREILTENGRK